MDRRARDLTKGLAAVVGLIVVVLGVPWSLVALGQGPPGTLPSRRAMGDWVSNPITNSGLVRIMALLCWAVWALFVAALVIEIAGQIAGRTHDHGGAGVGRSLRIPGFQRLAGAGVLTAMLIFPARATPATTVLAPMRATPAATVLSPARATPALFEPARPEATHALVSGQPPGWHRYVVHRYDSPWSIAERQLGDGSRWRELRDERGRPLWRPESVDRGDRGEREDEPELHAWRPGSQGRTIYPGDVLLVPGRAAHPDSAPAGGAVRHVARALPDSEAAPGIPATWSSPRPAVRQVPGAPPPQAALSPPVITAVDGFGSSSSDGHRADVRIGVSLLEAGIVSASVFGVLELLRRRQTQHRSFGRRIRLPTVDAAAAELALRMGRRPEPAERVHRAVHAFLVTGAAAEAPMPVVLGAIADIDAVELLLAEPVPAPRPWSAAAGGFGWRLVDADMGAVHPACSEPLPALTPIGKAVVSDADVFVNFEAAGVIAITGDPARASEMILSMAAALVGLPWAGAVNLVLVGFGDELGAAPQVRTVPTIAHVLAELRSTATVVRELLATHRCPDVVEARIRGLAGDGWPPTAVLCARPPTDADLVELVALAGPGTGVVAVVPTDTGEAGWKLRADVIPMPVGPLRLAVDPTVLPARDLSAVGRLFAVASDEAGVSVDDPPYDRLQLSAERDEDGGAAVATVSPPPLFIRVLGSVEIEGGTEFKRAKSRELAVYLAMHPNGVGEAEMDEALWPSELTRVVPPSTRDSTVSVARTALGGPGRLLPAQGQGREKRYQVGPEVGSDFALFCRLHHHGRSAESVESLRAALELVRGRPFEGVISGRTYTWVHTEGHARHIESEVGDAADLAARLFLERGQPLEARWAARQGLAGDPLCERLWIRLMEAADILGESQEIERLMDELDTVLELGGDFSGLHPNTLAAYDRYRRGNRPRHG